MMEPGDDGRHLLWAPWREAYILGEKAKECVFCFDEREDHDRLVIWRGETVYVVLNRYPYTNGHLLVVPVRHVADFMDLSRQEAMELTEGLHLGIATLRKAYRPEGFNVGMNLGEAAGAGVAQHLHAHIVPRWSGDTNYMTVVSNTRVLCQDLSRSRDLLHEAAEAVVNEGRAS